MAEPISIQQLKDASLDAKTLEEAVNGDAVTTVLSRLGESYPTLANALSQIDGKLDSADAQIKQGITDLFENGGLPATPFETHALMASSNLPDGSFAVVTNDGSNTGLYVKKGTEWERQAFASDDKLFEDTFQNLQRFLDIGVVKFPYELFSTSKSSMTGYTSTGFVPTMGMKYAIVRGASTYTHQFLQGETTTGDIVNLIDVVQMPRYFYNRIVEIPSNVVSIQAAFRDRDQQNYDPLFDPYLALTKDERASAEILSDMFYDGGGNIGFDMKFHYPFSSTTTYDSSLPMPVVKGTSIEYSANGAGTMAWFISFSEEEPSIYDVTTLPRAGVFIADKLGFFIASTYNSDHSNYDPSFESYVKVTAPKDSTSQTPVEVKEVKYLESPSRYLPSPILKTIKQQTFLDGTHDLATEYLWHDADYNFYISSTVDAPKKFIFKFDKATMYDLDPWFWSMNFDATGNIICVMRTDALGDKTDDNRKNPIILERNNEYKPKIVDLGSNLKPSGWFQNCGFLTTDNSIMFTEYVRESVETAHTWKVTYPVSNPENWVRVQSFSINDTDNKYPDLKPIKHIHSIDRDPFTGFIYTTTGDSNIHAGMYVSKDGGEVFEVLLEGSQKYCRTLKFIFFKDEIYWATDAGGSIHYMFKAPRTSDGTLDIANVVDLELFASDSPPTYALIYMAAIDAIVVLGRYDGGSGGKVPVDVWDLKNNMLVRVDEIPAETGQAGFRCECFEYYPRGLDTICGFSRIIGWSSSSYKNLLSILGNGTSYEDKVNNLVISVNRVGDSFNLTYSTKLY